MMFGGRKAQRNADTMDAAFAKAEASIVEFGQAVAGRIAVEFRAGRIDSVGVDQRIDLAMSQAASAPVAGVPKFAMKQLLASLQDTIVVELAAAGIVWEAPTP